MAADPADLTTVANLAAWLGLTPDQPTSDQLQRLVTASSLWIQENISRTIRSLSYTEARDGHGGDRLFLGNYPVTAVASLTIDGVAVPASTSPSQAGYVFNEHTVALRGYRFREGIGNVQVAYTAGFSTIPGELAQACLELAALRWKDRDRIGHVSKSIGGETVTFMVKDMPESVRTILNQYRKVVPL